MRILVVLPVALILLFVVYNVFFTPRRVGCTLGREPVLTIDTVRYGNFQELIPATGIVTLDSVSNTASVKVPIDQIYFSRMALGLKASTVVNNQDYALILISIDSLVTEFRFNIVLQFDGEVPPSLMPDQSLRIRLSLSPARDAVQLSVGGFYKDTGGSYVYVVKNDLAIKRNVVLGRKNPECFEVLSGLTPGEMVITSTYEWLDKLGSEDTLQFSEIKELYQ